jgi:hypothetical protein
MTELKPCPYCGGKATYCDDKGMASNTVTLWVTCYDSSCMKEPIFLPVNLWNTRPLEDAFRDALENVSSALHREIEKNKLLDVSSLRQYDRAQKAEDENAKLRVDALLNTEKIASLCEALNSLLDACYGADCHEELVNEISKKLVEAEEALK